MKNIVKMMLGAAFLSACGVIAAQETTFNTAADWSKNSALSEADGILTVKKKTAIATKRFDIDPSKRIKVKLSVRSQNAENENDKSLVYFGFSVFDQNGRLISCTNSRVASGTLTEVAEDAAKGSTVLKVKDASKFKKKYMTIVAGAREDLSDLPNRNIVGKPKEIARNGDVWEITLMKPLARDVKAGTAVREHFDGGFLYTGGVKLIGSEWTAMSGAITGVKNGSWQGNVWPAGAAKAQLIILVNYKNKPLETQFKDISMTVE